MKRKCKATAVLLLTLCFVLMFSCHSFAQLPDNAVTRAEFVTLANRAFNITVAVQENFSDVAAQASYAEDVARAKAAGYIGGYGDGTFRPDQAISRQEVAVIMARLLKLDTSKEITTLKDGADIPSWSRGAVGAVVAGGIMQEYADGTFKPKQNITGAEAAAILDQKGDTSTGAGSGTGTGSGSGSGGGGGESPLNLTGADLGTGYIAFDSEETSFTFPESVPADATFKLLFDRGVIRDYWENNQGCFSLRDKSSDATVSVSINSEDSEKETIFLTPEAITPGETYVITISPDLQANNGQRLGKTLEITFNVAGGGGDGSGGGKGDGSGSGGGGNGDLFGTAMFYVMEASVTNRRDVNITFNKEIAEPLPGAETHFSVTVDGGPVAITSVESTNTPGRIKLNLEPKVPEGSYAITISYDKEGGDAVTRIKAIDEDVLESFDAYHFDS